MTATATTGNIGAGVPRGEAPAKVTGAARYAADHTPPGTLHAVLVGATVAAGTLTRLDPAPALAVPGVIAVLTAQDMPRFGEMPPVAALLHLPLQGAEVSYEGEPVAVVLAETIAAAEAGRAALRPEFVAAPAVLLGEGPTEDPPEAYPIGKAVVRGDVAAAAGAAAHRVEAVYRQPPRHHNAMETSATVATWDGDSLTLWDATQSSANVVAVVTAALGIEPADLRVISPHVGGGFGAKAFVWPHEFVAAAAARIAGRPVKLHLRRPDQYSATGFQADIRNEVLVAADSDGRLTALRHHLTNSTSMLDTFVEPGSDTGKYLYACPNVETRQWVQRASTIQPTPMRAPMEGVGLWAVEGAMNELAHAAGIDPLELRLRNYAETDPQSGRPWSSKKLREAYEIAAADFGWWARGTAPDRDGPWRLGRGMATCTMGTVRAPGQARVRLDADGRATIEVDLQDIGTGSQTVFRQVAAAELGLAVDDVDIAWGDTRLPATSPLYSSSGTLHTGSAVALASRDICRRLAPRSGEDAVAALRRTGEKEITSEGSFTLPGGAPIDFDGGDGEYAMRTFGAVFVEVGVDPDLGLLRLRRAVGAYSCGRVLNEQTARAQMIGGIVWGWGKATMEASLQDPGTGRWLSKNLSSVHVPVNADIPADIRVHFVDEYDPHASPIGVRGMGEIGATGVDAAVADAVFDAIGIRVRELPLNPKRLLDELAASAGANVR